MSWAIDSIAGPSETVSGTTVDQNHTVGGGANRLVVAAVTVVGGRNVTGVTYNGVAMTAVPNQATATREARLYYLLDASIPAAGTYQCRATVNGALGGGTNFAHIAVASFTGIDQTTPQDSKGTSYDTNGGSFSDAVTPTGANAMCIAALIISDLRTITVTGGQGAADASLDATARSRLYIWAGPTPAAITTSAVSFSSNTTGAHNVAAFGEASSATPPTSGFTASVARKTVTLTNTSVAGTNPITSTTVDWGDGTVNSLLVHTYAVGGTYTITLTSSDGTLTDPESHDVTTTTGIRHRVVVDGGRSALSNIVARPDA